MNITLFSLISSFLLSNSPAFTGNDLSLTDCKFQKFSSFLFYNQKKLFLRNSIFSYGLEGVIRNTKLKKQEGSHLTIFDESFNSLQQLKSDVGISVTITECSFNTITNGALLVENNNISLYITGCTFNGCKTENEGILNLKNARCLTITHTCAINSVTKGSYCFLYYNCIENDFSVFLYNTIAKTTTENSKDGSTIFSKSGNQHFRCCNLTSTEINGYQFDAPICFSFSMMTAFDCSRKIIEFSGYLSSHCETNVYNKTIENVNFFTKSESDNPILRIDSDCSYSITIMNSVLLSKNNLLVNKDDESKHVTVILVKCIVNSNYDSNKATYIDPTPVEYSTSHLTILPHYTNEFCKGPDVKDKPSALGCNAGNCIDSLCNKTIGFPDDVIQYTTILHLDINTPTPSPTNDFSQSSKFSSTQEFSTSQMFTESKKFLPTSKFTNSMYFSSSIKFTTTQVFTESDDFTLTKNFTLSDKFTSSNYFGITPTFKPSNRFTNSDLFTKSDPFTKSSKFSFSKCFTQSSSFSNSDIFEANNNNANDKGTNATKIGIIAGLSAGGVAVIAVVVFFIIRKRKLIPTSDFNMLETNDASVTMQNDLDDIMNEDDPFKNDF